MKHQYILYGYPLFVPPSQAKVEQISNPIPLKRCQHLAKDLSLYLTVIVRQDRDWQDNQAFIATINQAEEEWYA
jgi:hypothetical protein